MELQSSTAKASQVAASRHDRDVGPVRSAASSRLLLVDDDARNLRLLESLLMPEGYVLEIAKSGEEALAKAVAARYDLILLDVMMPGMDGFQVCAALKAHPSTCATPVIIVTSLDDRASRLTALNKGAEDFLTKPIDRAELWARVRNLLRLKAYADLFASEARALEARVVERSQQLTTSYRQTIQTLATAASFRDEETGAHVQRISHYCVELASTLGLDREFCESIQYASPMHDVGKIGIPDRVLLKPGPLDADEWTIMKTHAALGARMLEGGDSPYLSMGRDIAMSHHERWDGSGYPHGLSGEAIPLAARLMCIADVYDALRSARPYKAPVDHASVVRTIRLGDARTRPQHFDPVIHDAFLRSHVRLCEIYESMADERIAGRLPRNGFSAS